MCYMCNGFVADRCIRSEVGGREFQRWGAEMRKERLEILSLDVRGESERQRHSHERVLPVGLTFMSLRRYKDIMCNEGYFILYPLFNF